MELPEDDPVRACAKYARELALEPGERVKRLTLFSAEKKKSNLVLSVKILPLVSKSLA